jgi:hypothetical protein
MAEPIRARKPLSDFVNRALDSQFRSAMGSPLKEIAAVSRAPTSRMQHDLNVLDLEAERLAVVGARMTMDNPALSKALSSYLSVLTTAQQLVNANGGTLEFGAHKLAVNSVTARVFLQLSAQVTNAGKDPLSASAMVAYRRAFGSTGVKWNLPKDISALVTSFTDTDAWWTRMEGWGTGYARFTEDTLVHGISTGWGPKEVARQVRLHATNIPMSAAENLTRTLQVTAYREGSLAMEQVNGQFIQKKIRIARLDERTCLSCVSLHGTALAPGERVDDHYRGRCTEFYVVPGGPQAPEFMQADSTPGKRNFVPYQKGEDWFKSLPESRQLKQASFAQSPAKWNAWKSGSIALVDFVGDHSDSVFGAQKLERSLRSILTVEV